MGSAVGLFMGGSQAMNMGLRYVGPKDYKRNKCIVRADTN